MRLLVLCEGDAGSWASWSGITKSLVDVLRAAGRNVATADVDLHGVDRLVAVARTFALDRRRWTSRYHLDAAPFALRSRRAARAIAAHRDGIDVIVQVGATFEPRGHGPVPYVLCCDSNIRMAERGRVTGASEAAPLDDAALAAIAAREQRVYDGAAAVFTLSERLRRSFVEDFGLPAGRVHTMHAGPNFDVARLPPTTPRSDAHAPTILFVGRQFVRKGGDLLLAAFGRVRERLPEARLLIAGPPARPAADGVHFLGDLDKNTVDGWDALARAYRSADVFCLPTRFEPFGIAFIEAMHFGLPCVGPAAWAVPEMIVDGETGYLVPPDDVPTLADRLLRLLADPGLRRTMGAAGQARAAREFTWDRVGARMLDVIDPLVQCAAPSPC